MPTNVVISRIKPPLIRKNTITRIPQTIKIVISPTQQRTINLRETLLSPPTKPQTQIKQVPSPQPPRVPIASAISSKNLIKKRRTKQPHVQYITRDPTPESITKLHKLANKGRHRLLIIVGNGPSITEIPLDQLRHHSHIDILSVNKPDHRIWPTTYWAFFDYSQFRRHEDLWNGYNGTIFNSTAIKRHKPNSIQIKSLGGDGFSRDLTKGINIGRSSVFASMQIAYWLGYEHTYIVGVDMNPDGLNGNLHFYGINPDVDPNIRKGKFNREAECYAHAAKLMSPEERHKYTFCSLYNHHAFVDQFNKLDHHGITDIILQHADRLTNVL